jgi:hypothetical protein
MGLPSRRAAGLVYDRESHAAQIGVGPLGQARAEFGSVVVTPARDQPVGLSLQGVEQRRLDPIAGMQDDVGARHLLPHPLGQVARPLRDVGIGDQQ